MTHLIYDNYKMLEDKETQENIIDELVEISGGAGTLEPKEISEQDILEYKNDLYSMYFDDEVNNLDRPLDGRVIAIASMGLWNGRAQGYKIGGHNLNEVMLIGNEDFTKIYYDGFNVRKDSVHHDGTNYILFRELREDQDVERFIGMIYDGEEITPTILNRYTRSLRPYVKQVYGW